MLICPFALVVIIYFKVNINLTTEEKEVLPTSLVSYLKPGQEIIDSCLFYFAVYFKHQ